MKKILAIACAAALAFSALALAACGSQSSSSSSAAAQSDATITVAATPTPHAEVLNDAVAPLLKEKGYDLKVVEFNDYVLPNEAIVSGEVDANYFQHQPYLDQYNDENKTDIISVATVHFEPFGIFAGTSNSLQDVKDKIAAGEDVTISVPNDVTNEARALQLLAQEGLIEVPDASDLTVTVADITKPDNLKIYEVDAAQVPRTLQDVAIACINGNYAVDAGLTVDDALAVESADSAAADTYANIIAVSADDENSEKTQALIAVINDPAVRDYINKTYGKAVIPVF